MWNFLIVDDDEYQASLVKALITESCTECNYNHTSTIALSGNLAIKYMQNNNFDFVYLDIEMPDMSGLEIAEKISASSPNTIIIYVTAHDKYKDYAFNQHVFNYITKPIQPFRFHNVFMDAMRKLEEIKKDTLTVKDIHSNKHILHCGQIIYFEKCKKNIIIHLKNGQNIEIKSTFKDLCNDINTDKFGRCHKGFIVNSDEISAVEGDTLYLNSSNETLPIGRAYKQKFMDTYIKDKW